MRNRTLASIVLLTMLMSLSEADGQSILDLQRIEASKTRRRAQEIKIPEWTNRSAILRRPEFERLPASQRHPVSSRDNSILDSARIEWVRYLNSESLPGTAVANDVAVDAAGNVYVTGKGESAGSSFDILTMKYDPFGDLLWIARYDGPIHGIDIGNAIAVDAAGNVFVTGFSMSMSGVDYDYLTINYSNDGVEQWVARYDGPANSSDAAVAIALDASGSVYVAGSSAGLYNQIAQYDYATIKYSLSGAELWVARYNGRLGWGEDKATALAIDQWGNAYVTGSSEDTVGLAPGGSPYYGPTYATIKYTPQGDVEWLRGDTLYGTPCAIAVNDSGNAIVTGSTATVMYFPGGEVIWDVTNNWGSFAPASIALGVEGEIYIAGTKVFGININFSDSIQMIKYGRNGTLRWVTRFGSPDKMFQVTGLVLDQVGNAYIAGSKGEWAGGSGIVNTEIFALKYHSNGSLEWERTHAAPGATSNRATSIVIHEETGGEGDVVVAGGSGSLGFSTVSYNAAGGQRWARQAGGERLCVDYVLFTEIDDQGNIFIAGEAQGLNSRVDYVVAKYNSAGVQMWTSRFNNPGEFPGYISDMAVDVNGNVYLCGWVYDYSTLRDYVTVKFNAAGEQDWVARYRGQSGAYDDMAMAIDADANGNSFVTGLGASGNGWKMTTVKYDQTGNEVWVARSNDPGSGWDIVVDGAGSFYVGGITSPPDFMPCYTVIKYDPAGIEQWVARDSSGSGADVNAIALDGSGNVYLASAWTTVKFDNSGRFLWHVPAGGNEIFFDNQQGVYLSWSQDIFKYSTNGTYQWRYYGTMYDAVFTVDRQGNTFILGLDGLYTSPRLVWVSPLGQEKWATVFPAQGDEDIFPGRVQVDATGNVYVACETGLGGSSRITLVKYNQVVVSVDNEPEPAPVSFGLSQNYPNPFNPSTKIQFSLPRSGMVSLKVYNTLGEEVASLLEGERTAGVYTLEWNANGFASGVYFYRLKAGEYSETKKLLLLK